jgi:hypothetical protein
MSTLSLQSWNLRIAEPRSSKMEFDTRKCKLQYLTDSLEMSPSWEATNRLAIPEFPKIVCNTKVYYRVHINPPLVTILSPIPQSCISNKTNSLARSLQANYTDLATATCRRNFSANFYR